MVRLGLGALALGFVTGLPVLSGHFSDPSHADALAVRLQAFPTGTPCTYEDSWHAPRGTDASGKPLFHEGVDIIAKAGTPILAASDGTITRMSSSTRGGTQIYLTRADGTYFFHAHLSAYAPGVHVGSAVAAGQLIAYVGQTGDAQYSVAHLHFEVHPGGGAPVNPYPIVREVDGCYGKRPPTTTVAPRPTTPTTPTTAPSGRRTSTTVGSTVTGTVTRGGSTPGPGSDGSPPPVTNPPAATGSGGLVPVAAARLADRRNRCWLHRQAGGEVQPLTVATRGGVDADAALASLTFTVVNPAADGFLSAFPCGGAVPQTSTVNFVAGQTVSNAALVGLGASGSGKGKVCIRTNVATDVLVDVGAYASPGGAFGFAPVAPRRLVDTRATTAVAPGDTRRVPVGAPGAGAVTLNVTSVQASGPGSVTVWPCGQPPPTSPTLTMGGGDIVPNTATVAVGDGGTLCVASTTTTHVVIDLMGTWQAAGRLPAAVEPVRLLDTRNAGARVEAGQMVTIPVAGVSGLPAGATGVQLNVTAVGTLADGFITVWPCGQERPPSSNLNPVAGRILANGALVGLGGGAVCVYSSSPTHLVVDVTGVLG